MEENEGKVRCWLERVKSRGLIRWRRKSLAVAGDWEGDWEGGGEIEVSSQSSALESSSRELFEK
jgi:hypothetical protein